MPLAGENELSAISKDPQALLRIPVGAVSPLWGLFAGAAMTGAAWWWMTRWTRPANLEAMFGAADAAGANGAARLEALAAPVVEAVEEAPATLEAVVEAFEPAPEPVVEAITETVEAAIEVVVEDTPPAPIAEALIEAAPEAIGGEAAPASPVLEALAPEVVEPTIEPAPPVEAAIDALADAAPEPKAAPKAKKPAPPKAD